MNKDKFDIPVLLLIFNRPDTTFKVFEQIKKCKPSKLFISADGPREGVAKDKEKCDQARKIIEQIDWDCETKTFFRERNSGCRTALSSAVNWFFENVEEGIILEDDCLPDFTFFRFCKELLEYYRNDKRITMISGSNFQFGRKFTEYSYYFSRYTIIWGWASWRRAWKYYDVDMKLWPEVSEKRLLLNILEDRKEVSYWSNIFEKVYQRKIDTWDYQWLFACWLQNGIAIVPDVNLVSNIGFGSSGTHTMAKSIVANLEKKHVEFPLLHPPYIFRDMIADRLIEKYQYSSPRLYKKIINIIYGR
ncbi:MAG: glycosyltransferase family 2 protein [Candidatus Omnitrophica bacterium]|nr:glycosyltransferase family 2 protein [Candidatus Omnitrophota bacterium]